MKKERGKTNHEGKSEPRAYRMRIPSFVTDEDIGLGDVMKRVTSSIGIKPCGGCLRRAVVLSHWLVFSGKRSSSR